MNSFSRKSRTFIPLVQSVISFATIQLGCAINVQIGQNFTGSSYGIESSSLPADGNGAAGPSHFVEFLNGRFSVYDKSNGLRIQSITDRVFWSRAGVTIASTTDITDPRIAFDVYSLHWFALQVDLPGGRTTGNRFLLAASESSDPTGAWHGVAFTADPVTRDFADFPTLGVDANGVYLGADMFSRSGTETGPTLISIPKNGLLQNPPNIAQRTSFGVLTYSSRGYVTQPAITIGTASTEETVLGMGNLGLDSLLHKNVIVSTIQGAAAGNATLSAPTVLTIPSFVGPINPTQPDGSKDLDEGDARISAFVRRVGDIIYGIHCIKVNTRDALQWFKIDAANKTLLQTGMITDSNLNLFYPSIAANEEGTVVVGCNGTGPNAFVSSYAFVGETVNGTLTFGNFTLLKAGDASVQNVDTTGVSRWGDYSATSLDPADPNRFWTIQMYPASATGWATQITEIITSKEVQPILQLSAPALSNGNFSFHVTGPTNANYIISTSTNLSDWTPVRTNVVDNGALDFSVAVDQTSPQSYYRVTVGP